MRHDRLFAFALSLTLGCIASATEAETNFFLGVTLPESQAAQRSLARFPCYSCHGRDAQGGTEGDVPAIDWATLSAPTDARPAYEMSTFLSAVTEGTGASGRELSRLMPRYDLTEEEIWALLTELQKVDVRERRGVGEDRVVFGVPQSILAAVGDEFVETLRNSMSDVLRGPLVYGRQVEFRAIDLEAPQETKSVFAIIGPPAQMVPALTAQGIPVVAPIGQLAGDEDRSIIRAVTPSRRQVLDAIAKEVSARETPGFVVVSERRGEAQELTELLQLEGLVNAAEVARDVPDVILLGNADLPAELRPSRLWAEWQSLASRSLPSTPETIVVLDAPHLFRGAANIGQHPATVLAATAGVLAGEALKLAGRDLTRTGFLAVFDDIVTVAGLDYEREPLTGSSEVQFLTINN